MAKKKTSTNKPDRSAGYMTATECAELSKRLLREEGGQFDALLEVPVLWVFSRKPITVRGESVPYRLQKIGGLTSWFTDPRGEDGVFDRPAAKFMVTVFRDAWCLMTEKMQEIMVFRAMCGMNAETLESGGVRLRVLEPDIKEFTDVVAKYDQNWLPASLMRQATTGQMELTVSEHSPGPEKPENPAKKKRGPIHDKEYEGGHLTG